MYSFLINLKNLSKIEKMQNNQLFGYIAKTTSYGS